MTNKNIYMSLGGLDPELILKAAPAEKVPSASHKGMRQKKKNTWVKWVSIAAALLMVSVMVLTVPLMLRHWETVGDVDIPAWFLEHGSEEISIDGIDQLNYYAAKKTVTNDAIRVSSGRMPLAFLPLYVGSGKIPYCLPLGSIDDESLFYFELDPEEVFTVTKVIAFQIVLENPENVKNGFLESRLGNGVIDVIITENSLETMITFRHGDNYFSCLLNGLEYNDGISVDGEKQSRDIVRMHFSTHKYIDGFHLVKNLEQDNYNFYIWLNERTGEVTDFKCQVSGDGSSEYRYRPDAARVLPGSSFVSKLEGSFTVAELERYYNVAETASEMEQ